MTVHDITPCSLCHVLTLTEFMIDMSDTAFPLGLCCEHCAEALIAESHDREYEHCDCSTCMRYHDREQRRARQHEARLLGGISDAGMRLLGWVDRSVS